MKPYSRGLTEVNRMPESCLKLVAFDMDGVLTTHPSSWKFIHEYFNVDNSENLAAYRSGNISYGDFMSRDISLWLKKNPDLTKDEIISILSRIETRENMKNAVEKLRDAGMKVAIVSGGVSWLADIINADMLFDYVYANEIDVDKNGRLTGKGIPNVIPSRKDVVIRNLQSVIGCRADDTGSIGDSYFDKSMFSASRVAIAFNPRDDEVRNASTSVLFSNDLMELSERILDSC